jgi:hypothetical protein
MATRVAPEPLSRQETRIRDSSGPDTRKHHTLNQAEALADEPTATYLEPPGHGRRAWTLTGRTFKLDTNSLGADRRYTGTRGQHP